MTAPTPDEHGLADTFRVACHHAREMDRGAHLVIAAPVALGAELLRLRKRLAPKSGRPKANQATVLPDSMSWRELVAQQTGKSYEQCRRCMAAAERTIERLASGSREQRAAAARLQDPPAEWTESDYEGLALSVGAVWDAQTFTELLVQAGVIRDPSRQLPPGGRTDDEEAPAKKKPLSRKVESQHWVRSWVVGLRSDRRDERTYRQRLRYLPVHPEDDDEYGLVDVRDELSTHLAYVEGEMERRETSQS